MALPHPSSATGLVGGLALVVAWSSGFIGAELGTRDAPASTLLAWRYVVAASALVLFAAGHAPRLAGPPAPAGTPRSDCCARRRTSAASWAGSASASHQGPRR